MSGAVFLFFKRKSKIMELALWRDTVACLTQGRRLFAYGRDQYAAMLLRYLLAAGNDIALLKKGPYGRLFDKAILRDYFASKGALTVSSEELLYLKTAQTDLWRLTLGCWGEGKEDWRWNQLSRPGYNLVLQLNFTGVHNAEFDNLVSACAYEMLCYRSHPISKKHRTAAWARLDFDLETGEVLIEEIQTDYIRRVKRFSAQKNLPDYCRRDLCAVHDAKFKKPGAFQKAMNEYKTRFMDPLGKYWDEVMMAATLKFCVEELACKSIYMHHFETGAQLKNIDFELPPKSIYTQLPKKFCFSKTDKAPEFLGRFHSKKTRSKLREMGGAKFWHLDFR